MLTVLCHCKDIGHKFANPPILQHIIADFTVKTHIHHSKYTLVSEHYIIKT